MDTPTALQALLRIATHDPDPAVRLAALKATVRHAWGETLHPRVTAAIDDFLQTSPDHPQAIRLRIQSRCPDRSMPTRAEWQQIAQITSLLVTLPDAIDRIRLLDTLGQPIERDDCGREAARS
jgi:hypothetical protein